MTCEVKKILGFRAGFYEHFVLKSIKKSTLKIKMCCGKLFLIKIA